MAKDPAFLFYPNDFTSGTRFMSDEQTGKYIRLLCAQFDTGHLKYEDMLKICKTHDPHIFEKFVQDSDGLYFNERLEIESIKRKKYSESRAKNRASKKDEKPTYVEHMENENEIINTTIIPTTSINTKYREQLFSNSQAVDRIMITFRDNGIKHDREHIEKLAIIFCNEVDAKNDDKQTVKLWSSHFVSWAKKNHEQYKPKARQGLQHG